MNRLSKEEFLRLLRESATGWIGVVPDHPGIALVIPDESGQDVVYLGPHPFKGDFDEYRAFAEEAMRLALMESGERKRSGDNAPDVQN